MNNNCIEVDELILEIADYKNDFADMAAEKLLRKCSTNWEAYQYFRDCVHDGWLPNSARQQLRRIIKRIQAHIHQYHEYGYAYRGVVNATFFECGHLPIEVCLKLSTANNRHLEVNIAIRKNRSCYIGMCSCKKYR